MGFWDFEDQIMGRKPCKEPTVKEGVIAATSVLVVTAAVYLFLKLYGVV